MRYQSIEPHHERKSYQTLSYQTLHPVWKKNSLHADVNYGVCILLYILILDPFFNHNFLKSTYVVVRKWVQY
jgi:hypothetical protein